MNTRKTIRICASGLCSAWILTGCGPTSSPDVAGPSAPPPIAVPGNVSIDPSRTPTPEARQRHVAFLNQIRQADPNFKVIDKAILNEQNELGLILDRNVPMDSIPALMKTMLTKMAEEFPNQDLNVIAYTPSNPPHKIGTAHLNARTRDMTYTPVAVPDR